MSMGDNALFVKVVKMKDKPHPASPTREEFFGIKSRNNCHLERSERSRVRMRYTTNLSLRIRTAKKQRI
jgi:hypothetical protein